MSAGFVFPQRLEATKSCFASDRVLSLIKGNRVQSALGHFIFGLQSKIPMCCVIAWVAQDFTHPYKLIAKDSKCWLNPLCRAEYVHCRVCAWRKHNVAWIERRMKS